jgi:CP family cyanate transporter-like MFS transporter
LVSSATRTGRAGITAGIYFSGALFGDALALAITLPVIYHLTRTYQEVFFLWSIPAFLAAVLCWVMIKEQPAIQSSSSSVTLLGKVLKNKGLWLVGILLFFHNFYFYTWANWGPQLMMQKGANPDQASLTTSLLLWVAVPTVFLMPKLAFRVGLKKPFLWVPGIALAFFAWAAIYANLTISWLIMILIGVVNITRFITILALPTEMVPAENIGAASGLIFCLGYLGATVGPIISGHILDLTGSLKLSLYSLVALSLIAAGIALFVPETSPNDKSY